MTDCRAQRLLQDCRNGCGSFAGGFPCAEKFIECFVYGAQEGDDRFYKLLSGEVATHYSPIRFANMRANIVPRFLNNCQADVAVHVRSCELKHPGGSLGYALSQDKVKIVYATDNEIDAWLLNPNEERTANQELRLIEPTLVDFVRDAVVLISDGQFSDEEYTQKVGWGHSSCLTTVDLTVQN